MNVMHDVSEARATALSLRASAKACAGEQGALKFRLTHAADALDAMVLLAVRGIERVEELEQQFKSPQKTHALLIAGPVTLDSGDCELILRALDVLDRDMQSELANKGQDAAAGETRSRILIVRAKLRTMQGGAP